jgi:hypothetical protein
VTEEQLVNIYRAKESGIDFIKFDDLTGFNPKSFDSVTEIPKVARYKGYDVLKGNFYIENGYKIKIDSPDNIQYIDDPKYKSRILSLNANN